MIGYLIRRVFQAIIVIIGVCAITFILYHLFPAERPPKHGSSSGRGPRRLRLHFS